MSSPPIQSQQRQQQQSNNNNINIVGMSSDGTVKQSNILPSTQTKILNRNSIKELFDSQSNLNIDSDDKLINNDNNNNTPNNNNNNQQQSNNNQSNRM